MTQKVNFDFRTIYWPGEDAPPQFEEEGFRSMALAPCVPRYSDRIMWREKEYFVYKITHHIDIRTIDIIATRRVNQPPKEEKQ